MARAVPSQFDLSASTEENGPSPADDHSLDPFLIHVVNPVFPKKVRKKNAQGQIVLSATIATDGTVKDVAVVKGDPALVDAAITTVRKWRYLPPMLNGKFIETTKEITIKYDFDKHASQPEEAASKVPTLPSEDLFKEIATGDLFRAGPNTGTTPPKAISAPDPEYTGNARRNRFQGELELGVIVGIDGRPRTVWSVRALGQGLDEKAIKCVQQWRFEPATRGGKPVPMLISVDVSFNLY